MKEKTHAIVLEIDDETHYRIEMLTEAQKYALTRDLFSVLTTSLDLLKPLEHYEF